MLNEFTGSPFFYFLHLCGSLKTLWFSVANNQNKEGGDKTEGINLPTEIYVILNVELRVMRNELLTTHASRLQTPDSPLSPSAGPFAFSPLPFADILMKLSNPGLINLSPTRKHFIRAQECVMPYRDH